MYHSKFITCFIALYVLVSMHVMGQVASPTNFPHVSAHSLGYDGRLFDGYWTDLGAKGITMGMNKKIIANTSSNSQPKIYHVLFDETMNRALKWVINPSLFYNDFGAAINKDEKIWFSATNAGARVFVFSETGTLHTQFKISNAYANKIVADTNGHIYMVYAGVNPSGFGITRFGSSFVPDFQKWVYSPATVSKVSWGIDQRLYVEDSTNRRLFVLNANGDVLKVIQNAPAKVAIYPDHGLAGIWKVADTVFVAKVDSNFNMQWTRKIQVPGSIPNYNSQLKVTKVDGVAMPGSQDLAVTFETREIGVIGCSNAPDWFTTYCIIIDKNGIPVGLKKLPSSGTMPSDRMMLVAATPFGDPLVLTMGHVCQGAVVNQWSVAAHLLAGYDIRANCGGGALPPWVAGSTFPYSSGINLGSAASVPFAVPLLSDNFAISFSTNFSNDPIPQHQYVCNLPCITLDTQLLGNGVVAFLDDIYGYYNMQYVFGDGTFGNTPDPVHTYPSNGPYPMTLTATNGCGSFSVSRLANPCQSAQVAGPTTACAGQSYWFTETSNLPDDSLRWLVNGVFAGIGDSLLWTPSAGGSYQIGAIFRNFPCVDTTLMTVTVAGAVPVPAFTWALTATKTLTFTNQTTGALSYAWTFGDATTSTLANPTRVYTVAGPVTICLTATNSCGSAQLCQTFNCPFPVANFTVTSSGATANLNDISAGGTSVSWDFGDGTTAMGPTPSHIYAATGTYTICQTITNACGSNTTCRTVSVITGSNALYRVNLAFLGSSITKGIASNAYGNTMVVGFGNAGNFILLTDSSGAVSWTKTIAGNSFEFNDVIDLPNGNFLVVGATNVVGASNNNGLWMEIAPTGTVVNARIVNATGVEAFNKVNKLRYGGYLLTGSVAGIYGFYARLDASLQMVWCRNNYAYTFEGFQSADSTLWLVESFNTNGGSLKFVHLNSNGVEYEEYTAQIPHPGTTSDVFSNKYAMDMDCEGNIFVGMELRETIPVTGVVKKLSIQRFNTVTRVGDNVTYRIGLGATANAPYYTPLVSSFAFKPDGNLLFAGDIARSDASTVSPFREKLLVEANAANLSISLNAFGSTTAHDHYEMITRNAAGGYVAAGSDLTLPHLHKFAGLTDCQLPVSNLAPTFFQEGASTSSLPNPISYPSAAYGSTLSFSPTLSNFAGASTVLCATPCVGNIVAGFTYTVAADTVTFTSTSTPGADLLWTVPGQSCLRGSTFSLVLPCGSTTTVSLRASNGCGASAVSQSIQISGGAGNPFLAPGLLADVDTCLAGPVAIAAANGYGNYFWSNGATTSSTTVMAPGSIGLVAQRLSNACFYADTAVANMNGSPLSLGPDTTVCAGALATFSAAPGFVAYAWSNGDTTSAITVATPGNYALTITNSNGCSVADTASLLHYAIPSLSIGPDQAVCPNGAATFNASTGFSTYLWSNGATTSSITINAPAVYSVTATDSNGCTAMDTAMLGSFPAPVFSLGPDSAICPNTGIQLQCPLGFQNYAWSTGAGASSITVTTAGSYAVTITDSLGCEAADTMQVGALPSPSVSIAPNGPLVLCAGDTIFLDAGPGFAQYLWSTTATSTAIEVTQAGSYTVTVHNNVGCDGISQVVEVFVDTSQPPQITLVLGTLWSTAALSYQWRLNALNIPGAVAQSHVPLATGFYDVRVQNQANCPMVSDTLGWTLVGLTTTMSEDWVLYPNPTPGEFFLRFGTAVSDLHVRIYNALGQLVWVEEFGSNVEEKQYAIRPNAIMAGVYHVWFQDGEGRVGQGSVMVKR